MAATLALGGSAVVSHCSAAALWRCSPRAIVGGRERRKGIRVHRSSTLIAGVTTRRNAIALTKPNRTLRDLHRSLSRPIYMRAVRRALDLRLIASADLRRGEDLTRSQLERIFLALCRRQQPEVNARVGPYEVDFLWRDRALVVETDGFLLRFTHRQLTTDRSAVIAALRALLGQSSLTPNL